jgi:hypothetical protein
MKTCFVIAPIGEPDSETRRRSDLILKHVISPVAEGCGYITLRSDQIAEPGLITSQVIQHIIDDPLVIADLTERNPNVFYELALRHALRKPLVQIIKKGEQIPFDIAGTRTIFIDHHDLDSVEQSKVEMVRQIEALEISPCEIETPISVAIELQILRQSENPEERSFAEIVTSISDLKSEIISIQNSISSLDAQRLGSTLDSILAKSEKHIMNQKNKQEELLSLQRDTLEHIDLMLTNFKEDMKYWETRLKKIAEASVASSETA